MLSTPTVWTVGHSNHDLKAFAGLVERQQIAYLVDVRSYPYSRYAPHFNREQLQASMLAQGIQYLFLGMALGGRPQRDDQFDDEGHARYDKMAQEPAFTEALDRLLLGASNHRLALLCSCGQPRACHRRLLVGKVLCDRGAELRHILPDGDLLSEQSVELRDEFAPESLFGKAEPLWRSTQSVSHRRRLSASSHG